MNRTEIKQLIISNTPNINDYKLNMIKRYLSFITSCECKQNIPNSDITEKHHILPKSIFSIYKNLKIHKWNLAKLTLRQHFIAHLMLHFIFGGKMTYALYHMMPQAKNKYNIDNIFMSKWYEFAKQEYIKNRKGFGCYKDQNNKIYFLHKNDKLIQELNLVGHQKGFKFNQDQITVMLNNRHNRRGIKIKVYFMKYKKLIFKDELNLYLSLGWNTLRNSDDQLDIAENIRINAISVGNATNEKYYKKGMKYYFYKDGSNYGFLYPNDPIINELNLSLDKCTDKMIKQRKKWLEASNKVIKGSKLYNNGVNQILLNDSDTIPNGYTKGGLSKPKKSKLIFDITSDEFRNEMLEYLKLTNGIFDETYIKEKYNVTATFMARLCLKNNINYREYWIPKKRYKVNKEYALEIYNKFNGDFNKISEFINTNIDSCKFQYKNKWNIE